MSGLTGMLGIQLEDNSVEEVDDENVEMNPSLQDQNQVVQEWWMQINPMQKVEMPVFEVQKFLVAKSFAPDTDSAGKQIFKTLGTLN